MSHIRDSTLNTMLCADCEDLRLDDEACGGFLKTSDTGSPVLQFNLEEADDFEPGFSKILMGRDRVDSSPNFPTLAKLAAAGCGFCGFLRDAILQANIETLERQREQSIQEEVTIRLLYIWGHPRGIVSEPGGLQALTAHLVADDGTLVGTLHFRVYSEDGTYCYRPSHNWF